MKNNKLNNDLIQLSGYIYKNSHNVKPDNWELIQTKENKLSGFYAEAYQNGNNIAIIYKGTDFPNKKNKSINTLNNSLRDNILNNLFMGIGELPKQIKDAREFYSEIKNKNLGKNINLCGHSLGGSLAQIVGAETGVHTVTYGAYGVGHILDSQGKHFDNIFNYGQLNDPIYSSNISNQIGNTYIMDGFNLNDPNELYLVKANSINTNLSLDHHKVENREPLENAKLLADKNINKFFYPLVLKGSISKTIDDLQKNNFLYTRDLIDNMTNEQYLNHESFIFDQINNIGFPSDNLLNQHNDISGFLNAVSGNSNIFTREDIKNMSSNEY